MGDAGLQVDVARMGGNVPVCLQKYALRRGGDALPQRFAGMAHGAAHQNRVACVLEVRIVGEPRL